MTVDYAHCRLLPGGAAKVLTALIRKYGYDEKTKIYTLFSRDDTREVDGQQIPVICPLPRWLQSVFFFFQDHRVPLLSWLFDYRNLMFFYQPLIARLRKKILRHKPDIVVISSFAVAKNIVPSGGWDINSTLYLHSPMQYIHTHRDEYSHKITGVKGRIFRRISRRLRKRDILDRSYDTVIANSQYTSTQAHTIYGISVDRIEYPPIDEEFGQQAPIMTPDDYFVYVGRLVRFVKEVDKLIELVNETGDNLVLIGSGPDEAYLKSIAGPTCLFVGWVDDTNERMDIIRKSRGLLNITKESFGIVTAEALLCGVPVLGYDDGATPELVNEQSGTLVSDKSRKTLHTAFENFKHGDRERKMIWQSAKKLFDI